MKALVIGGGIIGASTAWRLASEGFAVTVLERGRLGQEASWAAAGMIAPQAEADGAGPFFDLCVRARAEFEAIVERLTRESQVDPEYDRPGILYVALDGEEYRELERRARWQREAGVPVEELDTKAALKLEPLLSPEVVYALHMPADRRTDNRRLILAEFTQEQNNRAIPPFAGGERKVILVGHRCNFCKFGIHSQHAYS